MAVILGAPFLYGLATAFLLGVLFTATILELLAPDTEAATALAVVGAGCGLPALSICLWFMWRSFRQVTISFTADGVVYLDFWGRRACALWPDILRARFPGRRLHNAAGCVLVTRRGKIRVQNLHRDWTLLGTILERHLPEKVLSEALRGEPGNSRDVPRE